ncbi:MAG TPA: energy transducer TonB [Flavobacterium sp.]|jgi:protein TonB
MKKLFFIVFMFLFYTVNAQTITDEVPSIANTDNEVYRSGELQTKPDYPGGISKFYKFIAKNFNMPDEEGLNGRLVVSFIIEKDGSITDIKIVNDIGYGTGAEAARALKLSEKWIPGVLNGKKVRSLFTVPIIIKSAQ